MINPSTSRNKSFFLSSFSCTFEFHKHPTPYKYARVIFNMLHGVIIFASRCSVLFIHVHPPTLTSLHPPPPNLCIVWYSTSEEPSSSNPHFTLYTPSPVPTTQAHHRSFPPPRPPQREPTPFSPPASSPARRSGASLPGYRSRRRILCRRIVAVSWAIRRIL